MARWIYKYVKFKLNTAELNKYKNEPEKQELAVTDQVEMFLNRLGREGWELVHLGEETGWMTFKCPIESNDP